MVNSIKYLKFDFRIIKESSKRYFLITLIPFFAFMLGGESYIFAISYLFLLLIVLAAMPFSIEGNEKSSEMYYMFPSKISSMVLGRFLYLICSTFLIFAIAGIITWYLYYTNKVQNLDMLAVCLSGFTSLVMCFIQYPLYYKLGIENGRILSMIIYFIPAAIVLVAQNFLKNRLIVIHINNIILMFISLLLVIFTGYISYLISYKVCKSKEI